MTQWHGPLDLVRGELQNAVVQNLSGAPANPIQGLVYYDTTLKTYRGYNGTEWLDLGNLGVADHGNLTGLAGDDHQQYALSDGTRGDFEPTGSASAAVSAHEAAANPHSQYQTSGEVNSQIDLRVDKVFVDGLNVDADTLDGLDSTAFAQASHQHTSGDITDFTEAAQDAAGAMVTANTETLITVTYDDVGNKINYVVNDDLSLYDNTTSAFQNATQVDGRIDGRVTKAFVDALNVDADTLDGIDSTGFESAGAAAAAVSNHEAATDPHSQYQTSTEVNSQIDTRVTKIFVDALNVDADTLDGIDSASFEQVANRGAANGYASLDGSGKIPQAQIPSVAISETFVVADQTAMLALAAQEGDVAVRTDESKSYILTANDPSVLGNWQELLSPSDGVQSVSGSAPISSSGGSSPTISLNTGGVDTAHLADGSVTDAKLEASLSSAIAAAPAKYATAIGDGVASSIAVTHNLGTRDVNVEVYDAVTYKTVICGVVRNTANQVTLTFGDYVPTAGEFRVVVMG